MTVTRAGVLLLLLSTLTLHRCQDDSFASSFLSGTNFLYIYEIDRVFRSLRPTKELVDIMRVVSTETLRLLYIIIFKALPSLVSHLFFNTVYFNEIQFTVTFE